MSGKKIATGGQKQLSYDFLATYLRDLDKENLVVEMDDICKATGEQSEQLYTVLEQYKEDYGMKVKRTMTVKVQEFEVGDRVNFSLRDGEKVEAIAVKQIGDSMLFIHTNCLKREYPMYDEYNKDGYGGYEDSDLVSI